MKEFIKNLIARLEEYQDNKTQNKSSDDYELGVFNALEYAIKIINELAEEYKATDTSSGWIPCSERLPEVNVPVLTCAKDGWISVNINMQYIGNVKNDFECGYYVAWQPLPAPYQEGE